MGKKSASGGKQASAAVKCLQILLTVFNIIFWVSGIGILALGVWMKLQLYKYMELTNAYYSEAPYVLIIVGVAIIVVGALGCCCTIKGHGRLLYLYAAFLIVVFVVELGVAIASFVYKGKIKTGFKTGMDNAIEKYEKNKDTRDAVDSLQRMGCVHKVTSFMEGNFLMIAGIAIGFAFLQLFGAVVTCQLGKNINKLNYEDI